MAVREIILTEIKRVAAEHDKRLGSLDDDAPLLDTGLDSLCFAVLVARLEEQLNADPFGAAEEVALPVTVGDFVRFYEQAMV